MRYFSMFTGIGGFELGIQNAFKEYSQGGTSQEDSLYASDDQQHESVPICVGYSEIDKYAIATFESHFHGIRNYGNSNNINPDDVPPFDFLVGGFPCQAFSVAGRRQGFSDTRGTLFFDIARILENKRPRHFLLENVRGLLGHDEGKTFQTILGVLSDLGYRVEWQLLNSKDFGVPQHRERVYIIGHLRGECRRKILPIQKGSRKPDEINIPELRRGSPRPIWHIGDAESARRKILSSVKIRRFTPIECERLQGFPDGWTLGSDTQRYKQCGNAVTVSVVETVIRQLKECLNG